MKKCENFINEIVNFIKSNPVDDFEMSEKDTLYYIDWICDDNEYEEGEIKIYNEKYVEFSFGHSRANPDLLRYNTLEELEESLINMMGNMFASYNFPIIDGEGKNKKIIWDIGVSYPRVQTNSLHKK